MLRLFENRGENLYRLVDCLVDSSSNLKFSSSSNLNLNWRQLQPLAFCYLLRFLRFGLAGFFQGSVVIIFEF